MSTPLHSDPNPMSRNNIGLSTPSPSRAVYNAKHNAISPGMKRSDTFSIVTQQKETIQALEDQIEILRNRDERNTRDMEFYSRSQEGRETKDLLHDMNEEKVALRRDMDNMAIELTSWKSKFQGADVENENLKRKVDQAHMALQHSSQAVEALERSTNEKTRHVHDENTRLTLQLEDLKSVNGQDVGKYQRVISEKESRIDALEKQYSMTTMERDAVFKESRNHSDRQLQSLQTQLSSALEGQVNQNKMVAEMEQLKRDVHNREVSITTLKGELLTAKSISPLASSPVVMNTLKYELDKIRNTLQAQFQEERRSLLKRLDDMRTEVGSAKSDLQREQHANMTFQHEIKMCNNECEQSIAKFHDLEAVVTMRDEHIIKLQEDIVEIQTCKDSISSTLANGFKELLDSSELLDVKNELTQLTNEYSALTSQYEMAQRKITVLERTEAHLIEEGHLVNDLRTQIQTLSYQSSTKDASLFQMQQTCEMDSKRNTHLQDIERRYLELEKKNNELTLELNSRRSELSHSVTELDQVKRTADALRDRLSKVQQQLETVLADTEKKAYLLENSTSKMELYDNQITRLKSDLEYFKKQCNEMQSSSHSATHQLSEMNEFMESMKSTHARQLSENESNLRQRITEAERRNTELDKTLQSLAHRNKTDHTDIVALNSLIKRYKNLVETKSKQVIELKDNVAIFQKEIASLTYNMHGEEYIAQIGHLHTVIEEKNQLMIVMEKHAEHVRTEIAEFESLLRDRDLSIRKLKSAIKSMHRKDESVVSFEGVGAIQDKVDTQKQMIKSLQRKVHKYESLPRYPPSTSDFHLSGPEQEMNTILTRMSNIGKKN